MTKFYFFTIFLTYISSGIAWSLQMQNIKLNYYVMLDENPVYTIIIFLNKFVMPFVILLYLYKWWQAILFGILGTLLLSNFIGGIIHTMLSPTPLKQPLIKIQLERQLLESKTRFERNSNLRLLRKEKICRLTPRISLLLNVISFILSLICFISCFPHFFATPS